MEKPTPEELDTRFNYHAPDAVKVVQHQAVREACHLAARTINQQCPMSRETSLAMTKIEEAMMWANAAIARRA